MKQSLDAPSKRPPPETSCRTSQRIILTVWTSSPLSSPTSATTGEYEDPHASRLDRNYHHTSFWLTCLSDWDLEFKRDLLQQPSPSSVLLMVRSPRPSFKPSKSGTYQPRHCSLQPRGHDSAFVSYPGKPLPPAVRLLQGRERQLQGHQVKTHSHDWTRCGHPCRWQTLAELGNPGGPLCRQHPLPRVQTHTDRRPTSHIVGHSGHISPYSTAIRMSGRCWPKWSKRLFTPKP